MFGKRDIKEVRSFASITSPLSGIIGELESYVEEQRGNEAALEGQKRDIDQQIMVSKDEQSKASVISKNLRVFMDPTKALVMRDASEGAE